MTVLQIYLNCSEGRHMDLEATFRDVFVSAIRVQEGFVRVALIRSVENDREYQIELAFETEVLRKRWVDSDEHRRAFPKIRELCDHVSHARFDGVEAYTAR